MLPMSGCPRGGPLDHLVRVVAQGAAHPQDPRALAAVAPVVQPGDRYPEEVGGLPDIPQPRRKRPPAVWLLLSGHAAMPPRRLSSRVCMWSGAFPWARSRARAGGPGGGTGRPPVGPPPPADGPWGRAGGG